MNIVAFVKQVPDIEGKIVVEKGAISVRGLMPNDVINPLDLLATEEAIRIKERNGQGQVTVVSLGAPSAAEALRQGLAMGADEAILLCDPAFDGGDSYATALALTRALQFTAYDLILCGQRADDTQSGQVGACIARMLNIPLVQGVIKIDTKPGSNMLSVQRKLGRGDREVVECSLPVLLTVETGLNNPRYPTVRGVLKARSREIPQYDSRQLGLSPEESGLTGSKTTITHFSPPKPKMKGLFVPDSKLPVANRLNMIMKGGITEKKSDFLEGDPQDIVRQLVRFLKQQKIISDDAG